MSGEQQERERILWARAQSVIAEQLDCSVDDATKRLAALPLPNSSNTRASTIHINRDPAPDRLPSRGARSEDSRPIANVQTLGDHVEVRHNDVEHERRFLVDDLSVLAASSYEEIEQGYLWADGGYAVRVRRTRSSDGRGGLEDGPAFFTLKGPRELSQRYEKEIEISLEHASRLIELAQYKVRKSRHGVVSEDNAWVVDVFHDENSGLLIAEFEASPPEVAALVRPAWAGQEITADARYNNEQLAKDPWPNWRD